MRRVLEQATGLHMGFLALIDEDTAAFSAYLAARKLPKETDAENAARAEATERANQDATDVPLRTLEACVPRPGSRKKRRPSATPAP